MGHDGWWWHGTNDGYDGRHDGQRWHDGHGWQRRWKGWMGQGKGWWQGWWQGKGRTMVSVPMARMVARMMARSVETLEWTMVSVTIFTETSFLRSDTHAAHPW